ncbi:MAG: hypothetical protein CMJ81_02605 [Planctomycetaceae bacterium]|mgnify:CR=1 FL=1|jgi:hypothetical protein|nr:hypothetical protein [Planctomycetaceae bacterium]MBP62114.1 hypothetical protein [Planctomycetaceae bacterium]
MLGSENSFSTTIAVTASFVLAAVVGTSLVRTYDHIRTQKSEDYTDHLHKPSRSTGSDQEEIDQMARSAWSSQLKKSWQDDGRRLKPIAPQDKHPRRAEKQEPFVHQQRPG